MKIKLALFALSVLLLVSCGDKQEADQPQSQSQTQVSDSQLSGEIIEVLQTPTYTYLKLKNNDTEKWIAVTKMEAEVGKKLYYSEGLEMKNFESKTLNRVFPTIWFVSRASFNESSNPHASLPNPHQTNEKKTVEKSDISLEKNATEIKIADLYKNPSEYDGKIILVKGKVTKFNASILDRNWIHLQDGSEFNEKFDLTITSKESVKVGDVVVFKGQISLNKDFGAGYKYDIIMENAILQ